MTSFKIGGYIDEVFFPENLEDFAKILQENPNIKVFGNLSNTLISTSGLNEKIILTTKMNSVSINGTHVIADCGVKGPKLAQLVCAEGLSGLEFMIGFPGSVGGEVYMNASANSQAISDNLTSVTCFSKNNGIVKYSKEEMKFEYRKSRCDLNSQRSLLMKFKLK
jgi:UDP-N-acetylmuramate dehydrogenase